MYFGGTFATQFIIVCLKIVIVMSFVPHGTGRFVALHFLHVQQDAYSSSWGVMVTKAVRDRIFVFRATVLEAVKKNRMQENVRIVRKSALRGFNIMFTNIPRDSKTPVERLDHSKDQALPDLIRLHISGGLKGMITGDIYWAPYSVVLFVEKFNDGATGMEPSCPMIWAHCRYSDLLPKLEWKQCATTSGKRTGRSLAGTSKCLISLSARVQVHTVKQGCTHSNFVCSTSRIKMRTALVGHVQRTSLHLKNVA